MFSKTFNLRERLPCLDYGWHLPMDWHSRLNEMGEEKASFSASLHLPLLPDNVTRYPTPTG